MDKLREVKVQIAFDLSYRNMLPGYTSPSPLLPPPPHVIIPVVLLPWPVLSVQQVKRFEIHAK